MVYSYTGYLKEEIVVKIYTAESIGSQSPVRMERAPITNYAQLVRNHQSKRGPGNVTFPSKYF